MMEDLRVCMGWTYSGTLRKIFYADLVKAEWDLTTAGQNAETESKKLDSKGNKAEDESVLSQNSKSQGSQNRISQKQSSLNQSSQKQSFPNQNSQKMNSQTMNSQNMNSQVTTNTLTKFHITNSQSTNSPIDDSEKKNSQTTSKTPNFQFTNYQKTNIQSKNYQSMDSHITNPHNMNSQTGNVNQIHKKKGSILETWCDICADFSRKDTAQIPEFNNLEDLFGHIIECHTSNENKFKYEEMLKCFNLQFEENHQTEDEDSKECSYWAELYEMFYSAGFPKNIEKIFECEKKSEKELVEES